MSYPTELQPTILEGKVWADKLRVESLDGDIMFLEADRLPLGESRWKMGCFYLKNFAPFPFNGKTWCVPHQQIQSKSGYLKASPDCYHSWYFWKLQEYSQNPDGGSSWKPGTESGIYFRKPFSWRYDQPGSLVDGVLRHWIWTKGYAGLNWD